MRFRLAPSELIFHIKTLSLASVCKERLGESEMTCGGPSQLPKLPGIMPERGHIFLQFAILGILSVTLNTAADLLVVACAAPLERKLKSSARFRSRQRIASGLGMIGLGAYLAVSESK